MTPSLVPAPPPRHVVASIVRRALDEDLGRGDLTSAACIPADAPGRASFRARQPLVASGRDVVVEVYRQVDPAVRVDFARGDGANVAAGEVMGSIEGLARSLLGGERVALNLLQRMCGIATMAKAYVSQLPSGSNVRIADTRKTTPGLRALERYAVRCGGAHNHREGFSSAVLIKDNHIAAAGGVTAAIVRARNYAPHTTRIECEVDSLEMLEEALAASADVVLLDNFEMEAVRRAVALAHGRAVLEVSGGVTLERIAELATTGIDVISVGALTHSVKAADIGLDWDQ